MKTQDVQRLGSLGLSADEIDHYTLRQLWDKSLFLRRALLGETSVVQTHWRWEEFAPDIPKADFNSPAWLTDIRPKVKPVRVNEFAGYLLTTVGAGDLWTGLVTAGLSTPFTVTNAMCAVGDGTTAAAVGNTDLAAAAGTKLNAADPTSATNATPIVISATLSPAAVVGSVYVCSGFSGAGGAAANDTFEATATSSGTTLTLLNSAGTGAITVTGALIKPINYYRMVVNGAPSHSTNQVVFVAVFGSTNANFHAQEWMVCTGAATTNQQHQPPPHVLDRVVADNGTKAAGNTATLTVTATLA